MKEATNSQAVRQIYNRKLLLFPSQGQLIVCTDLHGNLEDFHAIRETFFRNLVKNENTFLLFVGDLIHGPAIHPKEWIKELGDYYYDESPALMEQFVALKKEHPGRVFSLLGNHEHSHIGGPYTSKFHRNEAQFFEDSVGPEKARAYNQLFRSFPLVALTRNGIVVTHASPRARLRSLDQLEGVEYKGYNHMSPHTMVYAPLVGELLWSRGASAEEARRFLQATAFEGQENYLSLYGHTVVREGYEKVGKEQFVFSTSFGLVQENKCYLKLSLEKEYRSVEELEEGREILPLYS